jgi:hypothetical protein
LSLFGIIHPCPVKLIRAGFIPDITFAGTKLAGIAAVKQFEEMVLRLPVSPGFPDGAHR